MMAYMFQATLAADPKISLIIIRFNLYGNTVLPFQAENSLVRQKESFFLSYQLTFQISQFEYLDVISKG